MKNILRHELQNILSANERTWGENTLRAASHYLSASKSAGEGTPAIEHSKAQEKEFLLVFAQKSNLWIPSEIFSDAYLAEGAEN